MRLLGFEEGQKTFNHGKKKSKTMRISSRKHGQNENPKTMK
jgi:hypothetical protein